MNLKKARILVEVESESELAKAVGEFNMKLNDGESIYKNDVKALTQDKHQSLQRGNEPPNIYERIAGKINVVSAKDKKIVAAAEALDREIGAFSENDFKEVLIRAGFKDGPELKKFLKRLLENDIIFQPKNGIYRYIEE
jgi:hypothetical protein